MSQENQTRKKFELCQRFFIYIKGQNVPILSNCIHEKHYSVKISSVSFFSSSAIQKFRHLLGCLAVDINSSLIFFYVLCVFQIYYA